MWSSQSRAWIAPVVNKSCSSPAVSKLVANLRPQYHICGLADRFHRASIGKKGRSLALAHVRDRPTFDNQLLWWCDTLSVRPTPKKAIGPVIVDIEDDDLEILPKAELQVMKSKAESEAEALE